MSEAVDRVMAELARGVLVTVESLALEIHGALVRATPVDTGFARSRWSIVDDESISLGMSVRAGQNKRGRAHSSLVSVKRARTTSKRPRYTGVKGTGKPKGTRTLRQRGRFVSRLSPKYIVNDAPYIGRLNDGWSQQAPAGFVQLAVVDAFTIVDIKLGNLDTVL